MNRRILVGAVLAVVIAVAVGVGVTRGDEPAPVAGGSPESAAGDSCRAAQEFLDLVARNGPASAALDALDRAVARARVAAQADPTWTALSGGVESLRLAVRADDQQAARVGTAVVREQCQQAGAPLTGG